MHVRRRLPVTLLLVIPACVARSGVTDADAGTTTEMTAGATGSTGAASLTDTSAGYVTSSGADSSPSTGDSSSSGGDTTEGPSDCLAPMLSCGANCIDPNTDDENCGGCGDPCGRGAHCVDGRCEPAGFAGASFDAALEFPNVITGNLAVGIAWDGTFYWAASGGIGDGITEAQYDAAGVDITTIDNAFDFRSIFTQGDGTVAVFARAFSDPTIYVRDAPGSFIPAVTLLGDALGDQSAVAWDAARGEFIAFDAGTLARWDAMGGALPSVAFAGYGMPGELDFPQSRGVAWANDCYLTYHDETLSAWDHQGNRVDTTTLVGAGTRAASNLSVSYANGHVWISDETQWRGYAVF